MKDGVRELRLEPLVEPQLAGLQKLADLLGDGLADAWDLLKPESTDAERPWG